jgi:hypothetical protein
MTDSLIDYYNEGAMDLITYVSIHIIEKALAYLVTLRLKDNEAAFNRYKIRPRVLVNVAKIDLETEMFGVKVRTKRFAREAWKLLTCHVRLQHLLDSAQQLCMDSLIPTANLQLLVLQQTQTSAWVYQYLQHRILKT